MINSGWNFHSFRRNNLLRQFGFLFIFIIALSVIMLPGCDKKTDTTADRPAAGTDTAAQVQKTDTAGVEDTAAAAQKTAEAIPDMKGTWTGTLEKWSTTLKITSQDSLTFKGSITINFREAVHQQVSGKINPKTMKVTMKDVLRIRSAGSYSGKLSNDGSKFSGTFTQSVDGHTASFNLTKK